MKGLRTIGIQTFSLILIPGHNEYLNHKSILFIKTGKYEKAEELLLNLAEKTCQNKNSIICADVNSNLGNLYRLLANFEEAKNYFVRAKRIFSTIGNLSEYAITNSNLALTLDNLDQIIEADSIYKETIAIFEDNLSKINLQYATLLNNYAGLLEYNEDYSQAEKYYKNSLDVISSTLGVNSEFYVTVLSNIGILHEYNENYEEAEYAYEKGLSIREKQLGKRHPKYVELLYNLAGLNIHLNPEKSAQYYKEANALNLELIHYYYSTFDQETRLNYLNKMIIEVERFYSLVAQNPSLPTLTLQAMNMSYELKGLALEYHIDPLVDSEKTRNPLYLEWKSKTDSIAQLITQEVKNSKIKEQLLSELIADAKVLERRLVRHNQSKNLQKNDLIELLDTLTSKTALVEFITFEMFEDGFWTDTVQYFALIYNSEEKEVKMLHIADEYELENEMNSISGSTIIGDDLLHLLTKIWAPLRPHIESSEQILVCPAGALSKMPMAAMSLIDNSFLFEKRIETFSSMRDISTKDFSFPINNVLLIGGIDFDDHNHPYKVESFQSIEGSLDEVNNISQLLSRERPNKITILTDSIPTEQQVRSILEESSFNILHFATHGFFYDQIDRPELSDENLRNKIITHENPMMRSGIVMSGANAHWLQPVRVSGLEDNIITSFEISNMTIPSGLVVLSACESGLGDIHNEEGVFGLQRAFKMAGVDKLIMSLWKIPDAETSEMMTIFYRHLAETRDIHESFKAAQQAMANKYDPFYWAGFVLIE